MMSFAPRPLWSASKCSYEEVSISTALKKVRPLNKQEVSSKAVVGPKKISSKAKAEGDKSKRELLEVIARRELPKDYPGGKGHQAFVDKWFKTAGAKGAEVGQLWKEQERLFPDMKNRGESFIKILDYVRTKGNKAKAARPTGNANPHIKRKVQAEIRREPAKPLGKTGALSGRIQGLGRQGNERRHGLSLRRQSAPEHIGFFPA
jgi:hypothetical protein